MNNKAILSNLKSRLEKLVLSSDNKNIRIRDAAKQLSVSEAELLSTKVNDNVKYLLIKDYSQMFNSIFNNVDNLMFLIRNDFAVHEKNISTKKIKIIDNKIINLDENNQPLLSFDSSDFKFCFYELKNHAGRKLSSLQIFDRYGCSVLKIYNKDDDYHNFEKVCLKYYSDYNYELQNIQKNEHIDNSYNLESIDRYYLKSNYSLKNNDIKNKNILRFIITCASKGKCPIQIHVIGNNSIQYHRDIVKNIKDFGPWFNIIDKCFNIHVLESKIKRSQFIEYTIENNKYYSIECLDQFNKHVVGVTSVIKYEQDFLNILKEGGLL